MTVRTDAGALAQMLSVPQGFTLSVAGTISIAVHEDGYPGDLGIWCFVAAGGLAFCAAVLLTGAHARGDVHRPTGLGLLNLVPVGVVPVAVLAGRWIGQPDLRMAVTGFACVGAYVLLLAAFVRSVPRRHR